MKTILVSAILALAHADGAELPKMNQTTTSAAPTSAPKWANAGSRAEGGALHAVGIGMSRVDALAIALAELAGLANLQEGTKQVQVMETKSDRPDATLAKDSRNLKSFDKRTFGNIAVQALYKDYRAQAPKTKDSEAFTSERIKVEMKIGERSFTIKVYQESASAGHPSSGKDEGDVQIISKNLQFKDLVDELVRVGIQMQTYEDGNASYVGLTYKPQEK